jgi:accessory gene regulator B
VCSLIKYIFTFKFIRLLSYIFAKKLQIFLQQNHKYRYAYYDALQEIIGSTIKVFLLLGVSYLFNVVSQMIVVTLSFAILRVFSGGFHLNSYTKCTWISLIVLMTFALLSKYIIFDTIVSIIIFFIILIIITKYAPVEHKNRPLRNREKIKFKTIAILILVGLYFIYNITNWNMIVFGVLLAGIICLPIINKLGQRI